MALNLKRMVRAIFNKLKIRFMWAEEVFPQPSFSFCQTGPGLYRIANFNPRAPHGARREYTEDSADLCKISIHALRMERDLVPLAYAVFPSNFNPRAPHGARLGASGIRGLSLKFQSTRSAWSATWTNGETDANPRFQSTRSAWSATDRMFIDRARSEISIHALRMERDAFALQASCHPVISIHALRMERDLAPPCVCRLFKISIHALRMERDNTTYREVTINEHFNPRAPHGARLDARGRIRPASRISIHALRMERDQELPTQ